MKFSILALALAFSGSTFAFNPNDMNSPVFALSVTTSVPFGATQTTGEIISSKNRAKEAAAIRADVSEYSVSGVMSPFLAQKISELDLQGASVEESLDALLEISEQF